MTTPRKPEVEPGRVRWSSAALVASNLVPIFGVFFWEWDLFLVLLAFWVENIVVGIYNVLRMAAARGAVAPGRGRIPPGLLSVAVQVFVRVCTILIFLASYGIFTVAHGFFIYIFFGTGAVDQLAGHGPAADLRWPLSVAYADLASRLWPMFLALMVSHGVSFVVNYLGGKEYLAATPDDLLTQAMNRLFVLHVTIILSAFVVTWTHNARTPIILLVALKIAVDLAAHRRERLKFAALKARRLAASATV
jgi:hypothetical protein